MANSPTSIAITGASRGIGAALARFYAAPGRHLALTARDSTALADLAADLEARGARVLTAAFDITDHNALGDWLAAADRQAPLDLVIANAGVSEGLTSAEGIERTTPALTAINIDACFATVHLAASLMRGRRHGQIALMSSLASYIAFARAPAYCASKAAVRLYGEGLRPLLAREGIKINTICPGFVRTDMTAKNDFPMPFLIEVNEAATIIARGLARNRSVIAFPRPMAWLVRVARLLPRPLLDRLA